MHSREFCCVANEEVEFSSELLWGGKECFSGKVLLGVQPQVPRALPNQVLVQPCKVDCSDSACDTDKVNVRS